MEHEVCLRALYGAFNARNAYAALLETTPDVDTLDACTALMLAREERRERPFPGVRGVCSGSMWHERKALLALSERLARELDEQARSPQRIIARLPGLVDQEMHVGQVKDACDQIRHTMGTYASMMPPV
jgi:hypothetical protein